jgi:4-hydroxy-2-oxoglutarate aldolase
MKLQGIFPSIATPFDYQGNLYKAKLQHNIEKWNRTTLSGYVVCGSAGESAMLSSAEKIQVWEWVAQWAAAGKLLLAGTGAESVRETVDLTNRAAGIGYKAALVQTPHYYKSLLNRDDAQLLYYRSAADESKIPIVIGNWPESGVDISAETVARLSEHPNIIALKESSGNLEKLARVAREVQSGFQILTGSAEALWPSLQAGASGAILGFANAAPYACITIWEAHRTREAEAAQDWQQRILEATRLVTTNYGIPGLKHAMDVNGYYGGPPRLPLTVPSPQAKQEIELAFAEIKG